MNSLTRELGAPGWRERLALVLERPPVQTFIMVLILINAVTLGLETDATVMARHGDVLIAVDRAILVVFVVEIALRLLARGLRFFRDPWSVFDFLVVGIALVPAAGPFSVLRALRVLRVLRLITILPNMRRVVAGLLSAIPGLASVFGIMGIIFYVSSVIATKLFGAAFPAWFGTIGLSAYSLFQVMTLESWSMGIARPVMEVFPYAWMFFVLFILIATFTMLNLFIAVIVNAIQIEHDLELRDKAEADATEKATPMERELRALRDEVQSMRALLSERLGARP